MQGVKVGARIAPNAFATADDGDCTEALRRWNRAGGFAFGQSPKRAAIIPDSRRALNQVEGHQIKKKGHIARHNAEK